MTVIDKVAPMKKRIIQNNSQEWFSGKCLKQFN